MSMDFLNNDEKRLLALYLKRVTFEDAYRRSDGANKEGLKATAYGILAVIGKVQRELANEGFSPR
jgi:hypothetical protein